MTVKRLKIINQFFPLIAGLIFVGLTMLLWHSLVQFEELEISKLEGGSVFNEVQSQMTARIKALERMAKRWGNGDTPDFQKWEFEAALNIEDFGGYQAISFIDDILQVRWVVPFVGNEAVKNADLSADATRRQALDKSRIERTTVITSQISLLQGGRGFLAVVPVFTAGENDGFIVGIFRTKDFFDTVLKDKIAPGFAVSIFEESEEIYTRLKNRDDGFSHLKQQSEFDLYGKKWKILVQPTAAVFEKEDTMTDEITLIGGLTVAFFFGLTIFQIQQSNLKKDVIGEANRNLEQEIKFRRNIEGQFRALLDAMTESIFVLDKDGYIYQIGSAETNITAAVQTNTNLKDLISDEMADKLLESIAVTFETGQPTNIEYKVFGGGGGGRVYNSNISPMSANRVVLVGRDVTEQKTVEAQLRASENNYRDLFDNASDLICGVGTDGTFFYVNGAWLAVLGYRQEELDELLMEDIIHPNEASRYAEILQRLGKGESSVAVETRFITKFGEERIVEGNLDSYVESGKGLSTRGIFRDITDRRQTETALERLRYRYETILSAAGEGILGIDSRNRITFANPRAAQMLGYTVEEMLGKFQYEVVYSMEMDDTESRREKNRMSRTLKDGTSQEVAGENFSRRDGTDFPVEYTSTPIFDNGAIVGAVIIFKDATARVKLVEAQHATHLAAIELAQSKTQFFAKVSHELRTPVSGIIGMAGLMLNTKLSSRQLEYGQIIDKSANLLLTLINDLLDFSKMEVNKLELLNAPFVLSSVIKNCLDIAVPQAAAKGIDLIAVTELQFAQILSGDAFRLQQILNNLIGNAVKFTERGEVVLSISQTGETAEKVTLQFTVSDSGIGIDPQDGASLFEPFAQGIAEINLKQGTGLGLHICRQLVEMFGGEISFDSQLGQGTIFRFTAVFDKQGEEKTPVKTTGGLAGKRILIGLGNSKTTELAARQTEIWGMEAVTTQSGEQLVELLREASLNERSFDVMLIEDSFALSAGQEFLSRISYDVTTQRVKTILLVPFTQDSEVYKDSFDHIAATHLTKPLFYWSLFQTIDSVLQKNYGKQSSSPDLADAIAPETFAPIKKSLRILIAEDNEINQKTLQYQLEDLGYQATIVGDGRQAVEIAAAERYDILLMDCHMPLMNGFDAAREIRRREAETKDANGQGEQLLIYALTATVNGNIEEECRTAGMNGYFSKPLKVGILADLLGGVVSAEAFPPENKNRNSDRNQDFNLPDSRANSVLEKFIEVNKDRRPELMAEIVGIFLRDTPNRLALLTEAVENLDFEQIEQETHRLRGTALNLGFDRMAKFCEKLELLKSGAADDCSQLSTVDYFDELKREIAIITNALREKYDGTR